jgi:Uma2 family endonuclease
LSAPVLDRQTKRAEGNMSTAIRPVQQLASVSAPLPPRVHRFTVEQYERMGELGILTPDDRVELLEGWIVDKMTQHPPHAAAIDYVQDALRAVLPADWRLRDQKPVRITDSLPEPDVAVVRGPRERYTRRHPVPAHVALVIEVADTTLQQDREWKGPIYARARIPVYWVVNLPGMTLEVYTQPRAGKAPTYRQRQDYDPHETVPVVIAGREVARIPVRELFPAQGPV